VIGVGEKGGAKKDRAKKGRARSHANKIFHVRVF
jgi:hypothetical protein